MKSGRHFFKPGSVVEYTRPDEWALDASIGLDEARQLEVLDLRRLDQ